MARTQTQWESFRELEWALSFAGLDLKKANSDELRRFAYEMDMFVRKAAGLAVSRTKLQRFERRLPSIQRGLAERLNELVAMQSIQLADREGIKDSHMSVTLIPADGSVQLIAFEGTPYRQLVKPRNIEAQVYAALASHVVVSGIVGGQLRKCPECGRLFLLKLKPQPNREFHCSTPCTNRATFRRHLERQRKSTFSAAKTLTKRVRARANTAVKKTPTLS
jgi:predicted RNA-binding Zn ribbon-like protein